MDRRTINIIKLIKRPILIGRFTPEQAIAKYLEIVCGNPEEYYSNYETIILDVVKEAFFDYLKGCDNMMAEVQRFVGYLEPDFTGKTPTLLHAIISTLMFTRVKKRVKGAFCYANGFDERVECLCDENGKGENIEVPEKEQKRLMEKMVHERIKNYGTT